MEIVENDDNLIETELTFQHDDTPTHYAFALRRYLNERFSGHWIGRR